MANYTFATTTEGWSTDPLQMNWNGADGSPSVGCMSGTGRTTSSISGLSIPVTAGDPVSFRYRIKYASGDGGVASASLTITSTGGGQNVDGPGEIVTEDPPSDSGWQAVSTTLNSTGTVTDLVMNFVASPDGCIIEGFFDSVYVAESPPTGGPQLKVYGLAADNSRLYMTGVNSNAEMMLRQYSLDDLTTVLAETEFGPADYTDEVDQTYMIKPVASPGNDLVVYLFGRDENNIQVQMNDLNGVGGWVDLGPGSPTWGTTKFCVALLPDELNPNGGLIAVFGDNDVYKYDDFNDTWAKMGDAPGNLALAVRHPTGPGPAPEGASMASGSSW